MREVPAAPPPNIAPPRIAPTAAAAAPVAPGPTVSGAASASNVWEEVRRLSVSTRRLKTIVDDLRLVSLDAGSAVVQAGALAALARSAQREIDDLFTKAAGRKIAVTIQAGEPAARAPAATTEGAAPDAASPASLGPSTDIRQHPLVKQAEELLGARVTRVEGRPRGT